MNNALLIILDGYGEGQPSKFNAVINSKTPTLDKIKQQGYSLLKTDSEAVGLLSNNMGGSEVGHTTIGAGRVVPSMAKKIFDEIQSGKFEKNKTIVSMLKDLKTKNANLHLIGLMSDKNIHSDINHLYKIIDISKDFAKPEIPAGLFTGDNGKISIMVNEEDHIREQCILSGFDLKGAVEKIMPLDNLLNRNFRFAKENDFYYTACPSNLGTGMRASVMLFLPALVYTDKIAKIMEDAKSEGITFRGAFGEGSLAEGFWYQVSNSRTLGSVSNLIEKVSNFVLSVCDEENDERYRLLSDFEHEIKDECMRAYGILTNCHLLSYKECINLIAKVKFASSVGVLELKNPSALDDLIVTVRPATLKFISDNEENEYIARANYVKSAFKII